MALRTLLAVLVAAASAVAADCRTSLNVPCFTVRGTHTQWQIFLNGSTDIRKYTIAFTTAVRQDSSTVTLHSSTSADLFNTSQGKQSFTQLNLTPDRQVLTFDHTGQTFIRRTDLTWTDLPYRRSSDGDLSCSTGIQHFGTDFRNTGKTAVAGVAVAKWYRPLANGGSEEVYLAPSLDCLLLKRHYVGKSKWHLPEFIDTREVHSVVLGEPGADLFNTPAGYREIEDPRRYRLVQQSSGNGSKAPAR